ncbi:MAG: hypothetical protein HDR26_07270 [Lachnospiraceae bacterium]|nr:hypothetical protein [Lachnospiraceae bacterium]
MAKKKRIWVILLLVLLLLAAPGETAYAMNTVDNHYTYDYWGVVAKSIPAFELAYTIDEECTDVALSGVDDVATGGNRIFLIDTTESRMNVYDADFQFVTSVKLLRNEEKKIVLDEDGNQVMLTNPEGVWFHESENEIFIADTGAERIVVLDGDDYYLKRIITRPENMVGVTQFRPSKIAVDNANKIYFVVQSGYEGIVELNQSGTFSRYFGVNKPVVNLWDYFWKKMSSSEQKSKMAKTYAPAFNNLAIDADGFVYATTIDTAAQEQAFRLNPKGENVLRQEGYWPVFGDLRVENSFIDVAINDYGVYALLDQSTGRIFLYDFDGELISIFGKNGDLNGDFRSPSAIAWFGNKLIATDKSLRCAYVYEMTEFGRAALGATECYYNGEWEKSAELSREALRLNANYDLAYIGIGKYYLMQDDFENAMYYFELGNDRTFYSKAYNGSRSLWIQNNFVLILVVILIAAALLVYSEIRYYRKKG